MSRSAPVEAVESAGSIEPSRSKKGRLDYLRAVVFLLLLLPLANLVWDAFTGGLEAEPIKDITHRTGWWALTLLLTTLAVTQLRRLTGWNKIIQYRRTFGLFAFFYACVHVLIYFGIDQVFSLAYIGEDIIERPYITVGFTAWVLLIPLAVTSTKGWIRRLGKRWQLLHRLIYPATILGVVHFYWQVKADTREPLIFAGILAGLLALRLVARRRKAAGREGVRPLQHAR